MKITPLFFSFFLLFSTSIFAQKSLLQSGPMLGYTDMFESMLWVQTNAPAKVQFAYWEVGNNADKKYTEIISTQKSDGYTAHLVADEVQPGKKYEYQLFINDQPVGFDYPTFFQTQTLWQWRTDPPPFKVALGSCSYINEPEYDRPGRPYGAGYEIFQAIDSMRPDMMLWLGDNTYLREVDWHTRTGFYHRYTHTRSLPELQPLLANTHHYAIWDDHDYGPNDSDRSFVHKELAKEVFQDFWANPTYGLPDNGGITSYFKWQDCDFFLLDNRSFRKPNRRTSGEPALLGETQMEWLIDALAASRAPFKFVAIGGQVLTTYKSHETYVNLCPEERTYLLKKISEEGIKNVIFLTGDRHHTEMSLLENSKGNSIYDLTVSPLTSGVHDKDEENMLRVENTLVTERNFGIMEISGPRTDRVLTISIFNNQGEELWRREIRSE
jgi:alkaline phosphatase D